MCVCVCVFVCVCVCLCVCVCVDLHMADYKIDIIKGTNTPPCNVITEHAC